jgi:thiosulfate reductase cytochrome b subunit
MKTNQPHKANEASHDLWLRWVHWLNVPMISLMIWSGLLIYWANDIYPGFFPDWFYKVFGIESRLADGMAIHFFIAWFFIINGLVYISMLFFSGHWRELFPDRKTPAQIIPTILHDMGLRKEAPPQGLFNAMQRVTYTGVIILAILGVASGFAIYKPVQLSWLTNLFFGYEGARLVHFIVMLSLCGFVFIHIIQVIRAGWKNFALMVGRARSSFVIFAILLACGAGLWTWLSNRPLVNETPAPFRAALNFNGKIWKTLFNVKKINVCKPPPIGQSPRVNGDIGLNKMDLAKWQLHVIANQDDPSSTPITITMDDIRKLPRSEISTELMCIEGWSEPMTFAGVKFSDFMKAYNISLKSYVGLATPDGEYYVSIDMASMLHEQTLLAYEMNGKPLADENGAPLRLAIPIKYGIKNLKRIGQIVFSEKRPPDYWYERGYDWYAGL